MVLDGSPGIAELQDLALNVHSLKMGTESKNLRLCVKDIRDVRRFKFLKCLNCIQRNMCRVLVCTYCSVLRGFNKSRVGEINAIQRFPFFTRLAGEKQLVGLCTGLV